jgi:hypothetical protein
MPDEKFFETPRGFVNKYAPDKPLVGPQGERYIEGYKVIPAKNVPSRTKGLDPKDVQGPFAKQGEKSDARFYMTTSLIGAKLYAYNTFNIDRHKRGLTKDYLRIKELHERHPEEGPTPSYDEFVKGWGEQKGAGKPYSRVAIIHISLLSKGEKPRKDLSETIGGYGDQIWVNHSDIVPGSIDIEVVGYFSEDDLKDIEKFESDQKRPHKISETPDIRVWSKTRYAPGSFFKKDQPPPILKALEPYEVGGDQSMPQDKGVTLVQIKTDQNQSYAKHLKLPKQSVVKILRENDFVSDHELVPGKKHEFYSVKRASVTQYLRKSASVILN